MYTLIIPIIIQNINCICGLKNTVSTIPCIKIPTKDAKVINKYIELILSLLIIYLAEETIAVEMKSIKDNKAKKPLSTATSK